MDADAQLAAAYGCKLTAIGSLREDGASWPEHYAVCPGGNRGAIDLLNVLANNDAKTSARVHDVGRACRAWGDGSDESTARQAQAFVQHAIAFREDDFQIFRPSDLTLMRKIGNCVNSARLVSAICQSQGIPARCVPVVIRGEIRHTAAQAKVDGAWRWLEATVLAHYDEPPLTAVARGAAVCGRS